VFTYVSLCVWSSVCRDGAVTRWFVSECVCGACRAAVGLWGLSVWRIRLDLQDGELYQSDHSRVCFCGSDTFVRVCDCIHVCLSVGPGGGVGFSVPASVFLSLRTRVTSLLLSLSLIHSWPPPHTHTHTHTHTQSCHWEGAKWIVSGAPQMTPSWTMRAAGPAPSKVR